MSILDLSHPPLTLFITLMRMEITRAPYAYDLPYWVEQEKLQWLDLESPDLPLKSGPVEDFLYVNIQDDSGEFKEMYF